MKKHSLMLGLTFLNELISQDEGMHTPTLPVYFSVTSSVARIPISSGQ